MLEYDELLKMRWVKDFDDVGNYYKVKQADYRAGD